MTSTIPYEIPKATGWTMPLCRHSYVQLGGGEWRTTIARLYSP